MNRLQIVMLTLLAASIAPRIVHAQAPGEVEGQVPVVEGVEKPEAPRAEESQGNAEARLPQAQPATGVQQPQVEIPSAPQQPRPQQD
jgi:hypothetical protein